MILKSSEGEHRERLRNLGHNVREMVKRGYEPVGGIFQDDAGTYMQAIVRKK